MYPFKLVLMCFFFYCSVSQAAPELSWRSTDWSNPQFAFPYERGEIYAGKNALYRMYEKFEYDVKPFGAISPVAANFWRFCVISYFAAKKGFKGFTLATEMEWTSLPPVAAAEEGKVNTINFSLANSKQDLSEKMRSDYSDVEDFVSLCRNFLKPEYHWWNPK